LEEPVIRRSGKLLVLYGAGVMLVAGWSLSHVVGGTVTHENAAGVIVFPLAWTFGFWPTVVPMLLAHRIWRLQSTLDQFRQRQAIGASTAEPMQDLEDTITALAAHENGIPERWVRPYVRRLLGSRTAVQETGVRDGFAPRGLDR
jgi:hypothetical protein